MMQLYIQANLLLAAALVIFHLLPKRELSYRGVKGIAQLTLVASLLAAPILYSMPNGLFPQVASPVEVLAGMDVDAGVPAARPIRKVLHEVGDVVAPSAPISSALPSIGLWLFGLGMLALCVCRFATWLKLSKLLKSTMTLHDIGRTTVAVSDLVSVPFSVLYLWRAYIILPTELIPYRDEFHIALRHEVEHHRRGDTFWAVFLEWLVCGFYLNPAIYLWRKTILQLQELACDEALISRMGISKQDYGSCLLRVAEMALGRRFMCAGTTCMIPASESNGHSFLRRRITMFAQHERSTAKKAAAIALGTLSLVTLVAGAYFAQAAVRTGGAINPGKPVFDNRIQKMAEESLRKGMALHNASGGFAIVSDPIRGTVIAAVSVNDGFDSKLKGDWALSYPLEPGSIVKPLIVATALQRGVTRVDEVHNAENGEYAYGTNMFHDSEPFDKLTTAQTVIESSNIGTMKVAQKLGAKGVENGLIEFGIGPNGSTEDFPAASFGHVPAVGSISDENYIGFLAHGVRNRTEFYVTPLEMVQAYGAIANGGRLMKPISAGGKRSPAMIRDVLSSEVSAQMRDVLKRVVDEGTGQRIRGSVIPLAGKTATVDINGNRRVTGFIGYAPADQPKLVVYVALFDVKGKERLGSSTAAPVFREIVEKVVPIFNP